MIQNDDCLICYDSLGNNNFYELTECRHRFCKSCIKEIIYNDEPTCPFDRKSIKGFLNFQKNEDNNNQFIVKEQSIEEYFNSITNNKSIQVIWNERIIQMSKILQKINEICDLKNNIYKILVENNSQIDQQNIINIQTKIIEKELCEDYDLLTVSDIFDDLYKETIIHNFTRLSGGIKTLFVVNLLNSDIMKYENYLYNFEELNHFRINKEKFIKSDLDDIDCLKKQCKLMSKCLINCALSFLNNNRKTFKYLQPDFNESDLNKCLICTNEIINEILFATFSQCQHKICKHCIEQFLISHASCPFDGDEINELIMIADNKINKIENVFNYLEREIKDIENEMVLEWVEFNENIAKYLIDNNDLIYELIEKMELIVETFKSRNWKANQFKPMIIDLEEIYAKLDNKGLKKELYTHLKYNIFEDFYNLFYKKGIRQNSNLPYLFTNKYSEYMLFLKLIINTRDEIYATYFNKISFTCIRGGLYLIIEIYDKISCPVSIKGQKRKISMKYYNEWILTYFKRTNDE